MTPLLSMGQPPPYLPILQGIILSQTFRIEFLCCQNQSQGLYGYSSDPVTAIVILHLKSIAIVILYLTGTAIVILHLKSIAIVSLHQWDRIAPVSDIN